jgi:hypothetical protein
MGELEELVARPAKRERVVKPEPSTRVPVGPVRQGQQRAQADRPARVEVAVRGRVPRVRAAWAAQVQPEVRRVRAAR